MKIQHKSLMVLVLLIVIIFFGCTKNKATAPSPPGATETPTPGPWLSVGNEDVSDGTAAYTSIAIDGSGVKYVAFWDGSNLGKITVKKLLVETGSWQVVGNQGFSVGAATHISLALDDAGNPYVAYADAGLNSKAAVMKFDSIGNSWTAFGAAFVSDGEAQKIKLLYDNGIYVGFADKTVTWKLTMKKYNSISSSWDSLGSKGFSNEMANSFDFCIAASELVVVVSNSDYFGSNLTEILKYNSISNTWVDYGTTGFNPDGYLIDKVIMKKDITNKINILIIGNISLSGGQGFVSIRYCNVGSNTWNSLGGNAIESIPNGYSNYCVYNDNHYIIGNASTSSFNEMKMGKLSSGASTWQLLSGEGSRWVSNISLYIYNGIPYVAYCDVSNRLQVIKYQQ